jgi:CRISPR/Cas system-associated exonuclease Cas4 (RecB family)
MIDIVKQLENYKRDKQKIYPCHTNRASGLGDECERRLVYIRTDWDKQLMPDVSLQYIFDEGNIQEEALFKDLKEAGIVLIEQQRAFSWPEYQISGMIDARVKDNGSIYPIEAKSMSPFIWDGINTIEDLKKYPWTSRYIAQMVLYLLLSNSETGIFILKNKSTGKIKQLNVNLSDYLELGESLLQKAKRINDHIQAKTLPQKINNFKTCSECVFRHICLPEILAKGGIEFIDNEELEKSLNRREELSSLSKEYSDLDKYIKEDLKRYMQDKEIISVGKWTIEKKVNTKGSVSFDFTKLKEG